MPARSFSSKWTLALLIVGRIGVQAASTQDRPHLQHEGEATQLVVGGTPFLMLGGELGNSSASSCTDTTDGVSLFSATSPAAFRPIAWAGLPMRIYSY